MADQIVKVVNFRELSLRDMVTITEALKMKKGQWIVVNGLKCEPKK